MLRLRNLAFSIMGKTVAREVTQLRPLQNPCCSAENSFGMYNYNRRAKIFIISLYHTLVTLIGLRLVAISVVRSFLGIGVSNDSRRGDSIPVSNSDYKRSRNRLPNYSCSTNNVNTLGLIPNAPTAALERIDCKPSIIS